MAKIICVALRKGGSDKTTTTTNIAAGLQKRGKRTAFIDLDDQANGVNFDITLLIFLVIILLIRDILS